MRWLPNKRCYFVQSKDYTEQSLLNLQAELESSSAKLPFTPSHTRGAELLAVQAVLHPGAKLLIIRTFDKKQSTSIRLLLTTTTIVIGVVLYCYYSAAAFRSSDFEFDLTSRIETRFDL